MKGAKGAKETITITFGECGENHVGMEKIGERAANGFSVVDLNKLKIYLETQKFVCEMYNLNGKLPASDEYMDVDQACVLVIKNCVDKININSHQLFSDLRVIPWDKQMWNKGKVTNKIARYNVCFAEYDQDPDYENKKGRVIDFRRIEKLKELKDNMTSLFDFLCPNEYGKVIAEGNNYYDITKCGIGYHGDTERKMVIACRFGATMPLVFRWYHRNKEIGSKTIINLEHGDVYIMSEKATGWDWHRSSQITLRHAAGCEKYVKLK